MLALTNLVRMISLRLNLPIARLESERGATAVEYGLMVALIAVVIIGAVILLGNNLSGIFNSIANSVGGATTTTTP